MTRTAKRATPSRPDPSGSRPAHPKRTIEELRAWAAANPFPADPTPSRAMDWHMAALDFEFGKGSYVLVEDTTPPDGFVRR